MIEDVSSTRDMSIHNYNSNINIQAFVLQNLHAHRGQLVQCSGICCTFFQSLEMLFPCSTTSLIVKRQFKSEAELVITSPSWLVNLNFSSWQETRGKDPLPPPSPETTLLYYNTTTIINYYYYEYYTNFCFFGFKATTSLAPHTKRCEYCALHITHTTPSFFCDGAPPNGLYYSIGLWNLMRGHLWFCSKFSI